MPYEYKQELYRAADRKFDGNLNQWAAKGWRVESIDRVDDLFLVTYGKKTEEPAGAIQTEVARYPGIDAFITDYDHKKRDGWRLEHFTAGATPKTLSPYFVCVWEKTESTKERSTRR